MTATLTAHSRPAGPPVPGAPALPQVNLLPPEVRAGRHLRTVKAWLGLGILVAVLASGLLVVWSQMGLRSAQDELDSAEAENSLLVQRQAEYAEVPAVMAELGTLEEARLFAMASETLWRPYIAAVAATAPLGVSVENLTVTLVGADATTDPTVDPTRVWQIAFEARSATLPDTAQWLDGLAGVRGLSSPWFSSAEVGEEEGATFYSVSGTVDVTFEGLALRFLDVPEEE